MNKDVIYIDVDDDVTAIISKIKKAKEKIVALVPPKRVGALQSAVNLRLLDRMAKNAKKQLVLITNNQALIALAANAKIPVAKNLQSKPELAEIPAIIVDNDDDIIDGSAIPVGDHAKTVKVQDGTRVPDKNRSDAIEGTDLEIEEGIGAATTAVASYSASRIATKGTKKPKSGPKIPNFDSFRKRLVLIGVGVAGLTALLVWMFAFAPAATVIITASTSPNPISSTVKLGGTAATDFSKGIVNSVTKQEKKDEVVEFEATGEKDLGEKAEGTLRVSKLTQNSETVPAGSRFIASGGRVFITQTSVVIPASIICFPAFCAQSVDVDVVAEAPGASYNGVTGSAAGPNGVNGTFQGATSGGTTKMAKVVSADDIERAKGQLVGASTNEARAALIKKFTNDEIIVDGSFTVERSEPVSSPAIDEEVAEGVKPTLTVSTTYTIHAVPKSELEVYLKASLTSKLDDAQKIYSTGIEGATLSGFDQAEDGTMTATVTATGRSGPEIDETVIKERVRGMIYGEVQQDLQSMPGIKEVDVEFSYFWVRRVPNDMNKITIEFRVDSDTADE